MRVTGGVARGIPLLVPKGDAVRPATDAMRQAVFSSLGERIVGARFLDLFAGSGAYGLEALSRGAARGTFVEQNAKAVACLRRNIAAVCKSLVRDESEVSVLTADVRAQSWSASASGAADVVFIDPPYDIIEEIAPALFDRLADTTAASDDAIIVFELPGEITLAPVGWTMLKRLGKGARQPSVCFFRKDRAP